MIAWLILIIVAIGFVAVLARTPPEPASADISPPASDPITDPASTSP